MIKSQVMSHLFRVRGADILNREYNSLKKRYIRYKLQSEILDFLAKHDTVPVTRLGEHMSHFKYDDIHLKDFHILSKELTFLENIGLCIYTDKDRNPINSQEDFCDARFTKGEPICCSITEKGFNAVQNRIYESLYISTRLNYEMKRISFLSICIAFVSLSIAIVSILLKWK